MHWKPRHQHNNRHFLSEIKVNYRKIDILSEQNDGSDVDDECQDLTDQHNLAYPRQCCVDVQQFNYDEGSECYGYDVNEGVFEKGKGQEHDDRSLVNALPNPNKEGFDVQLTTFLQRLVKLRVVFCFIFIHILIEDDTEHWEHGVNSGVTQHKIAVIDWDCNTVVNEGKDGLDDRNDQTTMNYEL